MLGEARLILTVLVLLTAVVVREPLLFFVALALLIAAGVSRLWARYCLDGLEYRRAFGQMRAFFGEEIDLTIEVVNRKLLPLAWLEIEDELPRALAPDRGQLRGSHKAERALLVNLFALRPYERVRRHYRIRGTIRGEHAFGPAVLRSGDVFGFETREETRETLDRLLIYPRILPVQQLGLPPKDPLGDRRARDWLFDDPTRIAGIREYVPGDSPRRVDWKATARSGALQVRLHEPTTTYRLVVALNLNTRGPHWSLRFEPDVVELAIVVAASIASWAADAGYQLGLIGNAHLAHGGGLMRVRPSRDPDQLTHVLEALARSLPFASAPFDGVLREESRSLPYGATIAVVTATLDEPLVAQLADLRSGGHRPVVLLVGDGAATRSLRNVPVYPVGPAAGWREMAALAAAPC